MGPLPRPFQFISNLRFARDNVPSYLFSAIFVGFVDYLLVRCNMLKRLSAEESDWNENGDADFDPNVPPVQTSSNEMNHLEPMLANEELVDLSISLGR